MRNKSIIKFKIKELEFYAKSYTNSNKPIPEGIIFMIQGLKWVMNE